jgi:hypothetical protein
MYRGVYEELEKLKQRFIVSENFVNEVIMVSKSTHHVLILPEPVRTTKLISMILKLQPIFVYRITWL